MSHLRKNYKLSVEITAERNERAVHDMSKYTSITNPFRSMTKSLDFGREL